MVKWISSKRAMGRVVFFVSKGLDQRNRFQSLITSHKHFHSSIQLLPYAAGLKEKKSFLGLFPKICYLDERF